MLTIQKNQPRVDMLTITPQMAERWLTKSEGKNFRKLSGDHVAKIIDSIRKSGWQINNDAFTFDREGVMSNGQHRAKAIVLLGITVKAPAMYGVTEEAVQTMDTAKSRTLADHLRKRGHVDVLRLAGILNGVILNESEETHLSGTSWGYRRPFSEALKFLDEHPEILDTLKFSNKYADGKRLRHTEAAVLHFAANKRGYLDEVTQFCEAVKNGIGLEAGDPARLLRVRLENDKASKTKMTSPDRFGLIFKAWNAWIEGRQMKLLMYHSAGPRREDFPVLQFPTR